MLRAFDEDVHLAFEFAEIHVPATVERSVGFGQVGVWGR
jgi:hypothetical protein